MLLLSLKSRFEKNMQSPQGPLALGEGVIAKLKEGS